MTINILPSSKFPETGRIFELVSAPSVIPIDNKPRIILPQNVVHSQSPAARHFALYFSPERANEGEQSVTKEVRLNAHIAEDGTKRDLIGIILRDGFTWDVSFEKSAVEILDRRLSHGCAIDINSSLKRSFDDATLTEVRGVLNACAPVEVDMHNKEKAKNALSIPDNGLDKENNAITVIMTEACVGSGSSCSFGKLAGTQGKIRTVLNRYYGATMNPIIK